MIESFLKVQSVRGINGDDHVARTQRQPLTAESDPYLASSERENRGLSPYSKEMDSANTLRELEADLSLQASR